MKYKTYSVYDEKAKAFLPPFVLPEQGQAIRAFSDCVNNKKHQFGMHPSDYTLFQIAAWDDADGIHTEIQKVPIGNGVEFLTAPLADDQSDLFEEEQTTNGADNEISNEAQI